MKTKVKQNQNILDLAVQHGGDISTAFDLARKNNIEVDEWVQPGSEIEITDATNEEVKTVFSKTNSPASSTITPGTVIYPPAPSTPLGANITLNLAPFLILPNNSEEDIELVDQYDNDITPLSVVGSKITVNVPDGLWQRNPDWLPIELPVRADNKITILFAVFENSVNKFLFNSNYYTSGTLGDGTSVTGVTSIYHDYDYTTVVSDVYQDAQGENYKQVLIILECDASLTSGSTWSIWFDRASGSPYFGVTNMLDLNIATVAKVYPIISNRHISPYLERFKIDSPEITTFYVMYATNLRVLDFDDTSFLSASYGTTFYNSGFNLNTFTAPNATTLSTTFRRCYDLYEIEIDAPLAVDVTTMFYECLNLRKVVFLDASALTTTANMFSGCFNLNIVRLPDISVDFSVATTNIDVDELVDLFNDLADLTSLPSANINITDTLGASSLSIAQRDIALDKNWTITG